MLDYAADSCKLSRTFGQDKDKTVLQFESTAPNQLSMIAIGKPLRTAWDEVPTKFLPAQEKPFNADPQRATSDKPALWWSAVPLLPDLLRERLKKKAEAEKPKRGVRPPPIDLNERAETRAARQAFAIATTELEIGVGYRRPVILETGSLGEPIKMFDQCTRNSLRDWGVDPDLEDKIVREVWAPNPADWFSGDDYPREMQVHNKVSEVRARLLVNASGNVTKCTSLTHYEDRTFNQVVCDLFMKRAKFAPAELVDGTKVPSYFVASVVFRLEP